MMLMQQMANAAMGSAIASSVARAIGAGRADDARALILHGLAIAVLMAALFMLVLLAGGPRIYALMGGGGAILAAALEYSNAIFGGALAYWALSALTSAVRGTGQVGLLALVYVAAEALHILLVPILVFGIGPIPPLGIAGAGLATVASWTVAAAVLAFHLASGRLAVTLSFGEMRPERRLFHDILRVGAPMCLQPILNNFALAALTAYAGTLGATALAAFGAAVRLEYLQYPLVFGLGAAVLAMVGTNVGAGRLARAARIAWVASALSAVVTGCSSLLALAWPAGWTGLFSTVPEVQVMAASYLAVMAIAYPFVGLNTLSSAFQAIGRPFWPLIAVACRALVAILGGWFVVHVAGGGIVGLGVATAAGLVLAGTIIAIAFRRNMRIPEVSR
jgi:putative MATE family efflux protein